MGRLYVAEQTGMGGFVKIVALKRILPHLADNPQFKEMFLAEGRVAARLEHPHIVTAHELGEVEGTYFISMEYLPGEDLAAVLSRCPEGRAMPVEIAVALAQQCANGLHYAHEARDATGKPSGLVHRDVNPSNIFVTYFGMAKLLDFGIVKGASSNRTAPGIFKGKYGYCAPEQILGGPIDRQTDVFCLGIAFWECLTGRRLFDVGHEIGTIDAVRSRKIEAPSKLRADVPRELDAIVLRALERDRSRRYASAQELSEALERFSSQSMRPSSKSIGEWLVGLFGQDRASLKKAIAQGNDIEGALARLAAMSSGGEPTARTNTSSVRSNGVAQPRALWATSSSIGPAPGSSPGSNPGSGSSPGAGSSGSLRALPDARLTPPDEMPVAPPGRSRPGVLTPPPALTALPRLRTSIDDHPTREAEAVRVGGSRRTLVVLTTLAAVAGAVGLLGFGIRERLRVNASTAEEPAPVTGALRVESTPPGAHILVDGDPSGLITPAVLSGLRAGRSMELQVAMSGYQTVTRRIQVRAGQPATEAFELVEAAGTLRLLGLPPRASVFVDDTPVSAGEALSLPLGRHRLRVETADDVLFADGVEIHRGEQSVRVGSQRRHP